MDDAKMTPARRFFLSFFRLCLKQIRGRAREGITGCRVAYASKSEQQKVNCGEPQLAALPGTSDVISPTPIPSLLFCISERVSNEYYQFSSRPTKLPPTDSAAG